MLGTVVFQFVEARVLLAGKFLQSRFSSNQSFALSGCSMLRSTYSSNSREYERADRYLELVYPRSTPFEYSGRFVIKAHWEDTCEDSSSSKRAQVCIGASGNTFYREGCSILAQVFKLSDSSQRQTLAMSTTGAPTRLAMRKTKINEIIQQCEDLTHIPVDCSSLE